MPASPFRHARALAYGATIATLVIAVTSCTRSAPAACTLIGCEDGVVVQLDRLPAAPFSVEVTPLPSGPATVKECMTAEACGTALPFEGVSADSIAVTVTSAAGSATTRVRPTYRDRYPNGRQCDPGCRTATVTARAP